jgi:DNA repair exonuclease SbcCD nuclease subunit
MSVKILHASDFHMDSPFDGLPENKAAERRREGRALLEKIAQLAEEERVQLVLLAGDLFDSTVAYYETRETLALILGRISAQIFISPGNHDFYSPRSHYASMDLPENVHIFTSPVIKSVDLPDLGCRVWGAGFNAPFCPPLLDSFSAPPSDLLDIMVLHGDTAGDKYNPVSEAAIASSNLDYLALGHIHTYSGIRRSGKTTYAYPGCPEGRGFDETGEKGVLIGAVSKDGCDFRFVPMGGREYRIISIDMSPFANVDDAVAAAAGHRSERDIVRIVLTGEFDGEIDTERFAEQLGDLFYHVTVRNETRPRRSLWAEAGEDTLKGLFLRDLKEQYDSADDAEKDDIELAVRYGLAALENGEEIRS